MRAIQVIVRFKDIDVSEFEEETEEMPFSIQKVDAAQLNMVLHTEAEGTLDELRAILLERWSDDLQIESLTLLE